MKYDELMRFVVKREQREFNPLLDTVRLKEKTLAELVAELVADGNHVGATKLLRVAARNILTTERM